ncbi:MAG: anti-sigma factor family protein [Bacillota bacterium]
MRCRQVQRQLPNYRDGAVDGCSRQGIEQHLAECILCQQELKAWAELDQVLSEFPAGEPPPELLAAIMEQVALADKEVALKQAKPKLIERAAARWTRLTKPEGTNSQSDLWGSLINLGAALAATWLFFTDWGSYSLGKEIISLVQNSPWQEFFSLFQLDASTGQAVEDFLWNVRIEVVGSFYSLLVFWLI